MKKFAYSNITKIVAFILMEILVMLTALLTIYVAKTVPNLNNMIDEFFSGKSYLESQNYRDQIIDNIDKANYFMKCQEDLEVAGEYNGNKEVTISQFLSDDKNVSTYGSSQVYKLQDLVDWSHDSIETASLYKILKEISVSGIDDDNINEEMSLIADANIIYEENIFSLGDEDMLLDRLQKLGIDISKDILEASIIKEDHQLNIQGPTLLSYCLDRFDFTEMEQASNEIREALQTIGEEYRFYKQYETYFKGLDSSNFKIYVQDYKGDIILNNCIDKNTDYETYFNQKVSGGITYNAVNKEFKFTDFTNDDINLEMFKIPNQVNYIYAVGIDTNYSHVDEFSEEYQSFNKIKKCIIMLLIAGLVIVFCFIYSVAVCGRIEADKEIYLNVFDQIKTEIGAVIMIVLGIVSLWIIRAGVSALGENVAIVSFLTLESGLFTIGFLSLVKRIKARQIWKNSLLYSVFWWLRIFFKYRKITTKIIIMYVAYCALTLGFLGVAIRSGSFVILCIWFLFASIVGFLLLKEAIARQSILSGIEKISDGNLEYKINTANLSDSNEILANAINNIGEGLHNAVDASVRNERLKTDLITNVSHDIKTPLTSIINYVDLIKRENIEDEKVKGYIDILDTKSQRLKNLTEDLVEASKISSGNIKLEMTQINFVELINQTGGEFSETFTEKRLQIITNIPEDPVFIHADGRRIWRVVENLYNNVAKYAMENTRVYVDMKADKHKVVLSIKNISASPLNIDADELTERFIRGDVSRSTEGSGLGLSIAKNLTTIQKGSFEIYLDGDLFKVTLSFPRVD